jgi:hypothetical protein
MLGCSTTKTVSVITENGNWIVGQHDYCVYKAENLLCVPQSNQKMYPSQDLLAHLAPGEKPKTEDIIFYNSIGFMAYVKEELKKQTEKLQSSALDTRFSEKPDDYSIWNCLSTGKGSPAIDCSVMKQPNAKEKEYVQQKQRERQELEAATSKLLTLSHTSLENQCGAPLQSNEDSISVVELYKGQSTLLAFHFDYFPKPTDKLTIASSLDSPPAKLDHDAVLSGKHHWWGGRIENESSWFLKELPCLNK